MRPTSEPATSPRRSRGLAAHGTWCLVALLGSAAVSAAVVTADDPRRSEADAWRLFRGNPEMTGVAGSALPAEPGVLWTLDLGSDIESTAAIAGGRVYVGDFSGKLHAVDLATGKLLWSYQARSEIQSSPSVHDGMVFFGDGWGIFHAVDAATGKAVWTFETQGEIVSSATFDGDRVLFGSYDQSLYALDRKTGALAWKVETEGYVHATPAIIGRTTTVSGCDGYLWLIDVDDGEVIDKIALGGQAGATPAVSGGRAFIGTYENQVVAIDVAAREIVWVYEHPQRKFPYYASAAVTGDRVLVAGRDKILRSLDPATGETHWEWNSGAASTRRRWWSATAPSSAPRPAGWSRSTWRAARPRGSSRPALVSLPRPRWPRESW
jgi:eukaryotic-like serine/threonine-protein kinase